MGIRFFRKRLYFFYAIIVAFIYQAILDFDTDYRRSFSLKE